MCSSDPRDDDLERVAASLHLADGRIAAEIGDAQIWKKPLALSLAGTFDDAGLAAEVKATARGLPLVELARLADIDGVESGAATIDVAGTTRCARLGDCAAAFASRVHAEATDVAVIGLAPFADVTRFHPVALAAHTGNRRTLWTNAALDLRLADGEATIDGLHLVGDVADLTLAGSGDVASGRIALTGTAGFPALRLDPGRNPRATVAVPIRVGGTLRRLEVLPGAPPPEPAGTTTTPTTTPTAPAAEPATGDAGETPVR